MRKKKLDVVKVPNHPIVFITHKPTRNFVLALNHPTETLSRFVVKKKEERSEVKIQEGPEGFDFFKGETYTYKYSFRAKEGMKVGKKYVVATQRLLIVIASGIRSRSIYARQ